MKILFVGAEAIPFISTGGLGDVLGSLPQAISASDPSADVRVVLPLYKKIKENFANELEYVGNTTVGLAWRNQYCGIFKCERGGVTYYFLDNEYYFKRNTIYGDFDDAERFAFFGKAVLDIMPIIDFYPDILNANDWQSATSVIYLKRKYHMNHYYQDIKTIYTIHNIDYQGIYSMSILGDVFGLDCFGDRSIVEYNGNINLTKGALVCTDMISTVSQKYADEIQTEFYSSGLHYILHQYSEKLTGIVNGIDVDYYNPANDTVIAKKFDSKRIEGKCECKKTLQEMCGLEMNPDIPVVSMISRLASHKGFDLVKYILPEILELGVQFVLLGTGEYELEEYFKAIQNQYPDQVKVFLEFNKDLSKKIYAGSDIFLMPSKSEPCGLSQMISSRYGAVPVVRETGGLYDTIKPYNIYNGEGNGFTFTNYNAHEMKDAIERAVKLFKDKEKWLALTTTVMETDFSWNVSAKKYLDLYRSIANK
ncbi:MAG: glycogen synthase GlgA [Clostridia bacterium]|nr:glycogen synthase GlgA [Clostridia bacterium]MBQ7788100.1 glycogen synthase GlgA [Clostridia bacterium]